jgi:hypothetical protein
MPITRGLGYILCICFFLDIQRRTKNVSEKIMAISRASVFILPLTRLVCGEFQLIPNPFFTSFYLGATLRVVATIAIIARTIELFIAEHHRPSQTVS